ncbi:MAG TPA: hypothetical protein VGC79_04735, partial [Polyangiaceae bacterium]
MNARAKFGLLLAFCTSVGVHGVAYASLAVEHRTPPRSNPVSVMNFELPPLLPAAAEPDPTSNAPEPAATPTAAAHAPPHTQLARPSA